MFKKFALCLTFALSLSAAAIAQSSNAAIAPMATVVGDGSRTYSVVLAPGESYSIPLPVSLTPIRIDASVSFENNGTLTPSEVVSALVNLDPKSGAMTWIGANNDGTSTAGNTNSRVSANIVNWFGGSSPTIDASIAPNGSSIKIVQNSKTTSISGYYIVRISY